MTQEEKSKEILRAEMKVAQAKANLRKAKLEERRKLRKEQDHHKFMMGGIIAKYFPECYDFNEQEMSRIIACAFKNKDIQNLINVVVDEREKNERKTGFSISDNSEGEGGGEA